MTLTRTRLFFSASISYRGAVASNFEIRRRRNRPRESDFTRRERNTIVEILSSPKLHVTVEPVFVSTSSLFRHSRFPTFCIAFPTRNRIRHRELLPLRVSATRESLRFARRRGVIAKFRGVFRNSPDDGDEDNDRGGRERTRNMDEKAVRPDFKVSRSGRRKTAVRL